MRLNRLGESDYARLTADTGLADSSIRAGREHFVKGRNYSAVARDTGVSPQRVRDIALMIEKAFLERSVGESFPSALVTVDLAVSHNVGAALEQWGRVYDQSSEGVRGQMADQVTQALLRNLRPRIKQRADT